MSTIFCIVFFVLFVIVFCKGIHDDSKKPLWCDLAHLYDGDKIRSSRKNYDLGVVFFWTDVSKMPDMKNQFFNGMYFFILEEGLLIRPPITRFLTKSVLLPWDNIKIEEDFEFRLNKIVRLNISNGKYYLGISKSLSDKLKSIKGVGDN